MFNFDPWMWRDPTLLNGGYQQGSPDDAPPEPEPDRAEGQPETDRGRIDLAGYSVHATDGMIGSVDRASDQVDGSLLIVDTGPWIFGRTVLLPAGTVERVDHAERVVYVDRTKQQVKDSPEFDPQGVVSNDYLEQIGTYYRGTYPL